MILFLMPNLLIRWLGRESVNKERAVICMKTDFSDRIQKALQSNANEEEDILIRQSYQMGYAEAERRVENAFQRGIHLGVSETVRSYERILSGKK